MTSQMKELKAGAEQGGRPWVARQAKILRRSINRLRVSGLSPDSMGTLEINEELGPRAGSPHEAIYYRLETHTGAMRGVGLEEEKRDREKKIKGGNYDKYSFCVQEHNLMMTHRIGHGRIIVTTGPLHPQIHQPSLPVPAPAPVNHRQGQSDVRRPYLQPWKQLEVNNEAWPLRFMSCGLHSTTVAGKEHQESLMLQLNDLERESDVNTARSAHTQRSGNAATKSW
ncbi:hypothetical protein EYF80_001901 [Liparis tanakae]|uniref:Uncharacterized protein n=1 Tax=Liparis tanakae TaxID=230148 RepID=A0A4Z2JD84_9TELE|nr:hypothetical protein EYF80_001901 [Liparis tanakae]